MKKVKISHLFHWLYAILMLLPVFAVGVTCAYAIFNKNAYQSYDSGNMNETKFNDVTNLVQEEDYYYYQTQFLTSPFQANYTLYISNITEYNIPNINNNLKNKIDNNLITNIRFTNYNGSPLLNFRDANNDNVQNIDLTTNTLQFKFELVDYLSQPLEIINLFKQQALINTNTMDNVFYYSIDKVQQSPLFSWSFDSFLAEPFEYITDVFSIPHNNVIVFFASYWLAISIIWLCFDLVMYVPNLVHKWLDKGSIS